MATPEDCPMIDKVAPQNPEPAGGPWWWLLPLALSAAVILVTAGINWGQLSRQDADRAAMVTDMKATDAALSSRIDRLSGEVNARFEVVANDKQRDNERIVRLEERFTSILDYVKRIDSNLEALMGNKRGPPSLGGPGR